MSLVNQTFEAQAFHPELGNEVVNGELSFVGQSLRFRAENVILEIPMDRLVADGSVDDDRVFLLDPEQPELKIITADPSFLACRAIPGIVQIHQQLSARLSKRELNRRLKLVGYFFVACCLIAWLCTVALGLMVRVIVARVPPEWEAQAGADLIAELKKETTFIEDTNYIAALESLVEPLLKVVPAGPTNFSFYIVKDDEPNALALPGGHVLVHTGLMDLTDEPEELLAVLAHELAHVTKKHHLRHEIAAGGPFLVFKTFMGGRGAANVVTGLSAFMVAQGFSQKFEKEADDTGWDYLIKANIDPRGMAGMFRKFQTYEFGRLVLDVPEAFSSHPALPKRIKRLEAKWKKLPTKTGFIHFEKRNQPES